MKVEISDLSLQRPAADTRGNSSPWHWFWARLFGRRMPTSGDRAHLGGLLLTYRPGRDEFDQIKSGASFTDAVRVHVIGDLTIYDYSKEPRRVETFEGGYWWPNKSMVEGQLDHGLLRCNVKECPDPK